jgi:TPR repeat protein
LQQDREKANELWKEAAALGSSHAHFQLGILFDEGGDLKKAKFHWEAAAMAGHERARCGLGTSEAESGNMERAVKHWAIAASAGCYVSMKNFMTCFEKGFVNRDTIDSTLTAYNNSFAEMRSEARDAFIRLYIDNVIIS